MSLNRARARARARARDWRWYPWLTGCDSGMWGIAFGRPARAGEDIWEYVVGSCSSDEAPAET